MHNADPGATDKLQSHLSLSLAKELGYHLTHVAYPKVIHPLENFLKGPLKKKLYRRELELNTYPKTVLYRIYVRLFIETSVENSTRYTEALNT